MLKALVLTVTLAAIVASGVSLASAEDATKVYDLSRTETMISEKLVIVPVDEDGVIVTETGQLSRKKESPKS